MVIDAEADLWVKEKYPDIESAKVFHIHGSITEHQHLYLPSETSMENYRSDAENHKIGLAHAATHHFLAEANVIILYGISLDPWILNQVLLAKGYVKIINGIPHIANHSRK